MEYIIGLIIFGFILYWFVFIMIWVLGAMVFYPQLLLIPIVLFLLVYSFNKLIDVKDRNLKS